ncbi:bifunctional diguanylate cyclase/phosphodiesterase [Parahaliea mediterranea]|uniref:cyclic-guanylate-specific phosphodiesterase n=1 Tax=Parahaliea mediterranea TaxID=651086 RepID=A0A939DHW2_9GAMM|nr:EAL domain-containing protein [Parahaliea mediterranea]MBN7798313.1 EAL domain-containing protein [Parahaliea mediterranea]
MAERLPRVRSRLLPWWISAAVLLAGLLATGYYWQVARDQQRAAFAERFRSDANRVAANMARQLQSFSVVMRGVQGLFQASSHVTHAEFEQYAGALEVTQELVGVQAVAFAAAVPVSAIAEHEAAMRSALGGGYRVHPQPPRETVRDLSVPRPAAPEPAAPELAAPELVAPIAYIHPLDSTNRGALGFDIFTNPLAREAAEHARDSGELTISAPLGLVQDRDREQVRSFVMYLPVYTKGAVPEGVAARRERIAGWVDVPFRMPDFIAGLRDGIPPDIEIEIHDDGLGVPDSLLYRSDGVSAAQRNTVDEVVHRVQLPVGDRRWTVTLASTPAYRVAAGADDLAPGVAAAGSALAAFLAALVFTIARGRDHSERRAARLSHLYHALSEINQAIVRMEREVELFPLACRLAVDYGGMRRAWVGLLTDDGQGFRVTANYPPGSGGARGDGVLPLTGGLARAATGESVVEWSGGDGGRDGGLAQLALPVRRRGEVVALLGVSHESEGAFEDEVMGLLRELADDLGFALDNFDRDAAREASEKALQESRERLSTVLENVGACVYLKDSQGRFTYVNRRIVDLLGVAEADLLGNPVDAFVDVDAARRSRDSDRRVIETGERIEVESEETVVSSGEARTFWNVKIPLRDDSGAIYGICGISTDITERRASEARLRYLSDYDTLTGLPNRRLLEQRARTILDVSRASGEPAALLYLDIDRFKYVNESMGHSVGDDLLQALVARLSAVLDCDATLSRLAADQFFVLAPAVSAEGAIGLAAELLELVSTPVLIAGKRLSLTGSIGIAAFPEHGNSIEQLTQSANVALSQAKRRGGNTYALFDEGLRQQSREALKLQNDLRDALIGGQLQVLYQPQVDIASGRVLGAEALLRWPHPELGEIPPSRFIPLAEEAGLIVDIGKWAMRVAVSQLVSWRRSGLPLESMAVNLSAIQLYREDFCGDIEALVREFGLAEGELELELTERIAMQHSQRTEDTLRCVRKLGVSLSIDDFGTGYSSLGYLKRYPLSKLKIDKSFIDGVLGSPEDAAIVRAIIALAGGLGFTTVAEGVETEAQLDFLRQVGCDTYQGYLFSRPLGARKFEELLASSRRSTG